MADLGKSIRSAILLLLLFSTPLCSYAQSHARFSVEPSDPALRVGIGRPGTEFEFSADVSNAESYRIEFGDGNSAERVIQPGADPKISVAHSYDRPNRYVVRLIARRASGESIELPLDVRVELPPAPARFRQEHARFSASQSGAGDENGGDASWADFTFIADVSNAESYALSFGDDNIQRNIAPGSDGRAVVEYQYAEPGNYEALMSAARDNGDTVEQTILVSVTAPPEPPSQALFSVSPSDPAIYDDIELPSGDFTFTADVTGATEYKLDFDDGETLVVMPDAEGMAVVRHVYRQAGRYDVRMTAEREAGGAIVRPLSITVRAPAAVPPPRERDWWPWILLAAALLLLAYTMWKFLTIRTGNHLVTFEPTVDVGKISISGTAAAEDAVSMRLRRGPGRIALAVNDGDQP